MMRITWSPLSIKDIESIVKFISEDDHDAAIFILDRIDELLGLITDYPQLGKAIDEQNGVITRESLIIGTYRLIYCIIDAEIQIISIRHTRQVL
jgi:plasmid stabilization system protein ParE